MFIAYLVVTLLAASANAFSATLDFIRYEQVLTNMARVGVPESWITMLGILKAVGAVGLLAGIRVPTIGMAAAAGLVLILCSCHHHSFAGTRLLVWPGNRVSPAGGGRAGVATGSRLVVRKSLRRARRDALPGSQPRWLHSGHLSKGRGGSDT